MNTIHHQLIQQAYEKSRGDSTGLFQIILSIASESSLDEALACLEDCVIERRLSWLERNRTILPQDGNPLWKGYRIFYEIYLGLSIPRDGKIIEETDRRLVLRWWNPCPTLDACMKLGLDTRDICRKAYHKPVQILFSQVDPRLRFERNYNTLRPAASYCEEIISLTE